MLLRSKKLNVYLVRAFSIVIALQANITDGSDLSFLVSYTPFISISCNCLLLSITSIIDLTSSTSSTILFDDNNVFLF